MKEYMDFIAATEVALAALNAMKSSGSDGRAVSIAITHLETAQLWATNALCSQPEIE